MLTPHAILIAPANFEEIMLEVGATSESLKAIMWDSVEERTPYYVVTKDRKSAPFSWMAYSKEELETEFQIIVTNQFDSHFAKIPA